MFVVDVQDDGRDLRMESAKLLRKVILGGQNGISQDQHDHDLARGPSHADQRMTKQSRLAVLIIDPKLELLCQNAERLKDGRRPRILDPAVLHGR